MVRPCNIPRSKTGLFLTWAVTPTMPNFAAGVAGRLGPVNNYLDRCDVDRMGTAQGTSDVVYLKYRRSERRGAVPIRSRPIGADTVFAQQWGGRRLTGPRPATPRPGVAGRSPRAKHCFAHNARLTHPTLAALTTPCRGPGLRPKGRHAALRLAHVESPHFAQRARRPCHGAAKRGCGQGRPGALLGGNAAIQVIVNRS